MILIAVNTSIAESLNLWYSQPTIYILANLKVIPQKGNDADNNILFHDTVYVVAAGGSGGGLLGFDSAEKLLPCFPDPPQWISEPRKSQMS